MQLISLPVAQNTVLCLKQLSAFYSFDAHLRSIIICFITITAGNPASRKYEVAHGIKIRTAF